MRSGVRRGDDKTLAPPVESVGEEGVNAVGNGRSGVAFEQKLGHRYIRKLVSRDSNIDPINLLLLE